MKKEEFYIGRIKYVEKIHSTKEVIRDIQKFKKETDSKKSVVQS